MQGASTPSSGDDIVRSTTVGIAGAGTGTGAGAASTGGLGVEWLRPRSWLLLRRALLGRLLLRALLGVVLRVAPGLASELPSATLALGLRLRLRACRGWPWTGPKSGLGPWM